ncbi:MAG: MerR family transcriptional regulator [Gemmatimonadetes bacterium]|nr:MerR family transcriptional regulator [Gemmatimonadota bacterium]
MSYRIKRVAHLTGINPATLRAWERRYGLVAPDRTGSGYRLYTDEDVAMLSRIKILVDEGLTIGEAISRVRRGAEPLPADAGGPSIRDVRFRMLEALVSFDRRGALDAYQDVLRLPPERRVEEVLLPVLRQVGELWEANECGVGEEHFASAFIREKLAGIIEDLDTGAARGPEAVCAGVPGELHECGLMAAAIHLATRGWRVVYLGTNVPIEEIRRILRQRRPALFCTSVVNTMGIADFRDLARALREAAPAETEVVIGGGGVPGPFASAEGVRLTEDLAELAHVAA